MNVKQKYPYLEDPKYLNSKIQEALLYYELSEEITLEVLQKWINSTDNPIPFVSQVLKEAYFESEIEAAKLVDLLTRLWNVTPRRELGGLSPQQKLASVLYNQKNVEK